MGYQDRDYAEEIDYGFEADARVGARVDFIRRVYSHVFGAILAFIALECVFLNVPAVTNTLVPLIGGHWWVAFIAFMVVSWVAGSWANSGASQGKQYFGLALYVFAESIIFVPLLWIANNFYPGHNIIPTAGMITLVIWGGLTAMVFITKTDFSFLRGLLMLCTLGMLGLIICSWIFGFQLGLLFTVFAIVLMSGFILYDTSNILHHYRTDQHVGAALALFASVATLLWHVIWLLMSLADD